jgi:WD40 repeat protein
MRILASGRKKLRFSTIAFDGTSRLAAGGGCNPTFVWDIASGDVLARLDQTIAFDNQSLHFRNGALLVPTDDG